MVDYGEVCGLFLFGFRCKYQSGWVMDKVSESVEDFSHNPGIIAWKQGDCPSFLSLKRGPKMNNEDQMRHDVIEMLKETGRQLVAAKNADSETLYRLILKTAETVAGVIDLREPGKEDHLSANCIETDLVFNIGVWGEVREDFAGFVKLNRDFEQKSSEFGGRKMLYAHSYYSFDEFWKVYDFQWYNLLRDKYHANDTFLTVYENTRVSEKYKPSIFIGIWNFIKSPFTIRVPK